MTGARVITRPGPRARRERARARDAAVAAQARTLLERGVSLAEIARRLGASGYNAPSGKPYAYGIQVARMLERA